MSIMQINHNIIIIVIEDSLFFGHMQLHLRIVLYAIWTSLLLI